MSDLHASPPPRKRARLSPPPSVGQEDTAAGDTEASAPQSFFSLVTQGAVHDAASSMLLMTTTHGSEETSTDDEELQQLSMVGAVAAQAGATGIKLEDDAEVGELVYEDVESVLFHTAKEQKLPMLQRSLRYIKRSKNADEIMRRIVKAEDETGLTLLMIAVRNNLLRLCTFLLQEGADVNQNNEKRTYALLLAAQKGLAPMTKFLVQHGANEESKNMSLIPAAHFGHLSVVKLLLEHGADLNYANKKGTTPLMRAAQEGRDNVVTFLIEQGVHACAANNEGMTALMLAAQRGHASIATILLRSGSDVDKQTRQGSTALLLASKRGHTAAVESLLTAGADIFLKDDRDKTAAETAHRRGHVDLFLKITVANQIRLMRVDIRRQRCYLLMRLWSLCELSRADVVFPSYRREQECELMARTMRLPRPLVQNIALYLPFCNLWDRQLKYLTYEARIHPNRVVHQGIRIIDEVLLSICLDMSPSLQRIRQQWEPLNGSGELELMRDCSDYRKMFMLEAHVSMNPSLMLQLLRMADIQGALASYSAGTGINFGIEVALDVVALVTELLQWDESNKRAKRLGDWQFIVKSPR